MSSSPDITAGRVSPPSMLAHWRGNIAQTLGSVLARSAAASFTLNVAANGLALVTAVVLARLLGAADYGVYSLALVWANILGFVACLGFPQLIVRDVARVPAEASQPAQPAADLVATATRLSLAAGLVLAGLATLLAPWLMPSAGPTSVVVLAIGMAMIVPIALQRLNEAVVLGAHRPVMSLLPERLVRPLLMLILIGVLALAGVLAGNAKVAVTAQLTTALATLATAVMLARRVTPAALAAARGRIDWRLARQALPFLFVGLTTLLATRLDVVMLGFLADAVEVGHYRLASQIAAVALLVATASQAILSPEISRHAAAGTLAMLAPQMFKLAAVAGGVTVLGGGVMVAAFDLLQPIIGDAFAAARGPLMILIAGYALMALSFPVLPLLTMTGHARLVGWANVAALAVNLGLDLVLIPRLGGTGAAIATLSSLVLLYGLHAFNVHRLGLLRQTA